MGSETAAGRPWAGSPDSRCSGDSYKPCRANASPMSDKSDRDNHANQGNPNNDAYWESRGLDERPDDWEDLAEGDKGREDKDDE